MRIGLLGQVWADTAGAMAVRASEPSSSIRLPARRRRVESDASRDSVGVGVIVIVPSGGG